MNADVEEMLVGGLNIFQSAKVQHSVRHGYWKTYTPINKDPDVGPLEFVIDANNEYLDLNDTILHLRAKVQRADARTGVYSDINNDTDNVALINYPLHSLFSDVEIYLNNKKIEGGEGNYALRSYISTLIKHTPQAQENQLAIAGFLKDQVDKFDDASNTGHVARKGWNKGKLYVGKLFTDFFQQDAYLLDNVTVGLKFIRNAPQFALMSFNTTDDNFKLKIIIEKAKLQVRRTRIAPELMYTAEDTLGNRNVVLEYPRTIIQTFQLEAGNEVFENQNVFNGKMPLFLAAAMVSSDSYNGYFNKNPYNFKHYDLCYLSLKKNGEDVPFEPLEPDFTDENKYISEYMSMFLNLGLYGSNDILSISKSEWTKGYTLFMYNLTPDLSLVNSDNGVVHFAMKMRFKKKLPENVMLVLYAIFNGNVQINEDREVFSSIY